MTLLHVLTKRESDPAVSGILRDLKSARSNYTQRDVGHLVSNLCRVLHGLLKQPLDDPLKEELREQVTARAVEIESATDKLLSLAEEYEAKGGKLLSHDEILAEVAERRGGSR